MTTGSEWLVDAAGCRQRLLRDAQRLRAVCDEIMADLGLHLVGEPMWHQFPSPGGVTGIYLLTESHLTCHTFPETGLAVFNLYCCRPRDPWPWQVRLAERLGAECVTVRLVVRGEGIERDDCNAEHLLATDREGR